MSSLALSHWQAILVLVVYIYSLTVYSGAAYKTTLPYYFSFAKGYGL